MADGWGGARPGSGRKSKAVTEMRRQALTEAGGDAERAFAFIVDTLKSEKTPLNTRMACAEIIMDRVWGKAIQPNKNDNTGELLVRVKHEYAQGSNPDSAGATPGAGENQT